MMIDDPLPRRVDEFLDESLLPEDAILQQVRTRAANAGLPAIEVSPQQGRLLTLLVRATRSKRVLEVGTLAGYSTICLARGMKLDGHVDTLELDGIHASVARANFEDAGHKNIRLLEGNALATLAHLDYGYDFAFIDADKENNGAYVDWAARLCVPGSMIVVDNVIRDGRVLTVTNKRKFIRGLHDRPNLDVSVVQTVSSKGWDGFVFAVTK